MKVRLPKSARCKKCGSSLPFWERSEGSDKTCSACRQAKIMTEVTKLISN